MVRDTLVFILAGGKGNRLMPLTRFRSKPSVPFAAQYRIIDFTVSNCVNSGLKWLYVLTQYKSNSLAWHVRYAYSHLFIPEAGEFITTVPPQQLVGDDWYRGTADAVYQNFQFLQAIEPEHALILAGDHIYKMDYAHLLASHAANHADITVAVIETPIAMAAGQYGVLSLDQDGRITAFVEKPNDPEPTPHNPSTCFASMGVYVFNTPILEELLIEDARDSDSSHDFGKDIIPKAYPELRVFGYSFANRDGSPQYWRDVGTLDQYFDANIDLVRPLPQLNMHDRAWPVFTQQSGLPPAKFVLDDQWNPGRTGHAVNSLVSSGCIISGASIHCSVLSPDVQVEECSTVKNAIIMSGVRIGKNVEIDQAIIDKHAVVPDGSVIRAGNMQFDGDYHITDSGIVVIPKKLPVHPPPSRRRRLESMSGPWPQAPRPLTNVLVIDDDVATRKMLRDVLDSPGVRPVIADSVQHALQLARENEIAVAFVDMDTGPIDGLEVIRSLRDLQPTVKVVLLAATPDDPRIEKARVFGIADCIYKPFDFQPITSVMRRLMPSE